MGLNDFIKKAQAKADEAKAVYETSKEKYEETKSKVNKVTNSLGLTKETKKVTVPFDSSWFESWEGLKKEYAGRFSEVEVSVDFPEDVMKEISEAVRNHVDSPRVPYSENKTPISCVGENFKQAELKAFCKGLPGDEMPWLAGFLMPEMMNPYDKNAVAILAISESVDNTDSVLEGLSVVQCGYMAKEDATKAHKKILKLLANGQYVPLLLRFTGGTKEKPNYGVFPYAMTEAITL